MPHEPKKKHSKTVKRIRRAAKALSAIKLLTCKNCNEKTISHMACRSCGFYNGKQVTSPRQQVTITKA